MVGKYKVVTLCGSTRFKDEFMKAQKELTLKGNIVISVGLFGHSGDEEVWTAGTKEMLDDMHNKILAGEFWNLAEARWFVQEYETRLAQYGPRGSNAEKYDVAEEREEDPRN